MTLSFADIESQHAELLPARTVMSLFTLSGHHGGEAESGPVACLISIGNVSLGLGLLLGSGAADGGGSSCNSTANA
jgi:hypothetical protein